MPIEAKERFYILELGTVGVMGKALSTKNIQISGMYMCIRLRKGKILQIK